MTRIQRSPAVMRKRVANFLTAICVLTRSPLGLWPVIAVELRAWARNKPIQLQKRWRVPTLVEPDIQDDAGRPELRIRAVRRPTSTLGVYQGRRTVQASCRGRQRELQYGQNMYVCSLSVHRSWRVGRKDVLAWCETRPDQRTTASSGSQRLACVSSRFGQPVLSLLLECISSALRRDQVLKDAH